MYPISLLLPYYTLTPYDTTSPHYLHITNFPSQCQILSGTTRALTPAPASSQTPLPFTLLLLLPPPHPYHTLITHASSSLFTYMLTNFPAQCQIWSGTIRALTPTPASTPTPLPGTLLALCAPAHSYYPYCTPSPHYLTGAKTKEFFRRFAEVL